MGTTVPNQNVVVVHRDMPTKGEGNLLVIKKRNLYDAYKRLQNGYAVCLYLYLAANQEGYRIAYSPQAISNEMGMPLSTCRDQFKTLIRMGYLVPRGEGSNTYDFYEVPKTETETAGTF